MQEVDNFCVVIPAYEARAKIRLVLGELRAQFPELSPEKVIVVDDGSRDGTAEEARRCGATVVVHSKNRGKGAALVTGLEEARARGFDVALTVDADAQHPAASARLVLEASDDPRALVLGVRNLVRDGAPRKNRFSNGVSNYFLSRFTGRKLADTQCGLRRYPIEATLGLGARAKGYAYEAEVILLFAASGLPIVEVPIDVVYPPEDERVTHFDSVRDPARIIGVVLRTVLGPKLRRHKKGLGVLVGLMLLGPLGHALVSITTRIAPPPVSLPNELPTDAPGGIRRLGRNYTRVRAKLREVYLTGSPEEIGAAHARLLRDRMVTNEKDVWDDFEHFVPYSAARLLLTDLSKVRYRHVDEGFPEPRRREIAAQALAFQPDPYAFHMPTYQRMVFLHSLYDIALSFEHSPLLGCSAFGLGPGATNDGHVLLARAFDFEAGEVFDRDKAVFFVAEDGTIPFASVAWPGLVGVMSGMNLEGVALVVNGGRARDAKATGEPVIFALREVLARAHDTREAIAILKSQSVMVSHIVFVADAHGHFAVVERAPGAEAFAREDWKDPDRVAVTNHFEGPFRDDPKNIAVRESTTTLPRRARLDELLAATGPKQGSVERAVSMLRDHTCAEGKACELGDRRTIDAMIATHAIVADTTERVLWVSAGPHLSGKFVRFDLRVIFAKDHDPAHDEEPRVIAEDPILFDGRFERGEALAGKMRVGGDAPK